MGNLAFRIESVQVLLPLLAGFAALLAVRAVRRRPGWYGKPVLTRLATALYAAGFLHFTMFPIIVDKTQNLSPWYNQIQPIPLAGLIGMDPTFVLNVLLFAPFGLLLPLLARRSFR